MSVTTYLCIGCPLGCRLEVEEDAQGAVMEVRGFGCKRGEAYARQEHSAPQRMVATTVAVRGAGWNRLPVRSNRPVPKAAVMEVCRSLRGVVVQAPVYMGQVIVPDVLGSGADIIATRDMASVMADGMHRNSQWSVVSEQFQKQNQN